MERLRERHKRETRQALAEAAIELFEKQGFERTTVEEIAAAADVAPRTFYRYFPTKEDVVFGDQAAEDAALERILRQRPRGEALQATVKRVIGEMFALLDLSRLAALYRLVENTPGLQLRALRISANTEAIVARGLLRGRPGARERFRAQVLAACLVAAWRTAAVSWLRGERSGSIESLIEEATALLGRGFD